MRGEGPAEDRRGAVVDAVVGEDPDVDAGGRLVVLLGDAERVVPVEGHQGAAAVVERLDPDLGGVALEQRPAEAQRPAVRVAAVLGRERHRAPARRPAPDPRDRLGGVEQPLGEALPEIVDALGRRGLREHPDMRLGGDRVGRDRLREADHARGVDLPALEGRRMGGAREIDVARGDVLLAAAEHHLHGGIQHAGFDHLRLRIGPEGGEGQRERLEERLVRARGAARDDQIGRVRREQVAAVAAVVAVAWVDVDRVRRGGLPQPERPGAVGPGQRVARQAAPVRPGGDRGRGVAERRRAEVEPVVQPVVEIRRLRRRGVGHVRELRVVAGLQRRMAAVAVVVEVAGVARGAAAAEVLAQQVARGGRGAARRGRGGAREGEPRLEPLGLGVPGGVGGGDRRRAAGDGRGRRRRRGRRAGPGGERGEGRRPGERREDRIGQRGGEARVAGVGGGLEGGARRLGGPGEHGDRGAVDAQLAEPGMAGDQRVEHRAGGAEVARLDQRQRPAGLVGDRGHGEQIRLGLGIGGGGRRGAGQGAKRGDLRGPGRREKGEGREGEGREGRAGLSQAGSSWRSRAAPSDAPPPDSGRPPA